MTDCSSKGFISTSSSRNHIGVCLYTICPSRPAASAFRSFHWINTRHNCRSFALVTFGWTITAWCWSILLRVICNLFLVLYNYNTLAKINTIFFLSSPIIERFSFFTSSRWPRGSLMKRCVHLSLVFFFSQKLIQWHLSCLDIQGQSERRHQSEHYAGLHGEL